MSCKATCYRSTGYVALVAGSLWAVSQGASADTVSIANEVITGNAPLMPVVTPVSSSGNFEESVTDGDTPTNGMGIGGRLSPYAFNTNGTTGAPYSVLGDGTNGGSPVGSATYNINAPAAELLWGSPDTRNQVEFFSGPDGMGTSQGTFTGANLGVPLGTLFSLVTFAAASGDIGSVELSNSSSAAFEFAGPVPVPLPPAIYLFASVLGGSFWLRRRKRSAVSRLGVA